MKNALLAGTILLAGCTSVPTYPELPSAPVIAQQRPDPVVQEEVRDMDPRSAVGGPLEYAYLEGKLYQVFVPYGTIVPVAFVPGDVNATAAVSNLDGWRIENMDAGRGRGSKSVLVVSADGNARRTKAVIATSGGIYMLDLIPRKTGHTMVSFHKASPRKATAATVPIGAGYTLQGPMTSWRPSRIVDDGTRTWVTLSSAAGATGMPVVMALTPAGERRPVNQRLIGDSIVIDGVYSAIEVRLGEQSVIGTRP